VKLPLIGTVMRLVDQKGPGILFPAVRQQLETRDMQFVLLGEGQEEYEEAARHLEADFPDKVAIRLSFDDVLAERIYAGIDLFLMPSLFEPCGIGQMLAMRYGALPLARSVGGLKDTVDPQIGFLFSDYNAEVLSATLASALDMYEAQISEWAKRQRRAMQLDFSWGRSASEYTKLYERAIALHQEYEA